MSHLQRIRSRPLAVAGACGVVILAASVTDAARAASLDLTSGAATSFTTADLGTQGASMGDVVLFEAPILGGGQLLGAQTSIDVWRRSRSVQSALTFDLPAGQIAVAGVSQADPKPLGLLAGRPTVRAVVGGSGSYAGMRGTVTSTRGTDGSYAQAISLTPPEGSTRTVSVISTSGPGQQIDVPAPGNSPGDLTIVDDAVLRDAQDAIIGTVRGVQQVISTTGGRVVQAQLTYTLPDGELLVGGISRQVIDGTGLLVGTTFVRPVLGGTGAYAGAGGTMTTTFADGRYEQRFDLSGLGVKPTQTLRLVGDNATGRTSHVEHPPVGVSAGDQNVYTGPLRDARGKRRVGLVDCRNPQRRGGAVASVGQR
jgi:hypothetical protein